jgi:hypothetical protein
MIDSIVEQDSEEIIKPQEIKSTGKSFFLTYLGGSEDDDQK